MKEKEKRKLKKPKLFVRTIQLLIKGKKHFFLYQIIYALIVILCMVPLTETLVGAARKFSGYSYITTENLGDFLCKPFTIVVGLILLFVVGFFVLWEIYLKVPSVF